MSKKEKLLQRFLTVPVRNDLTFKGRFPARINPELHRKVASLAMQKNMSLNKYVERALEQAIAADSHL